MHASSMDFGKVYRYRGSELVVLGISREEGIRDGLKAIKDSSFGLISMPDSIGSILIVTKDHDVKSMGFLYRITSCYSFEIIYMSEFIVIDLRDIIAESEIVDSSRKGLSIHCSGEYSAWYNTIVLNYLLMNQDRLKLFRNYEYKCYGEYTIENTDVLSLEEMIKEHLSQ